MLEKKSLYAIVQESQKITNTLLESGGELTQELENELQNLEVQLPSKIDSYAFILSKLEADEAYWKDRAKALNAVAKGCANVHQRIKDNLKIAAENLGVDELIGFDSKFKFSNSKPRLEINEAEIDPAYKIQVITYEIDKKRIEEDLKQNVPVKGAQLVATKSMRICSNKETK